MSEEIVGAERRNCGRFKACCEFHGRNAVCCARGDGCDFCCGSCPTAARGCDKHSGNYTALVESQQVGHSHTKLGEERCTTEVFSRVAN